MKAILFTLGLLALAPIAHAQEIVITQIRRTGPVVESTKSASETRALLSGARTLNASLFVFDEILNEDAPVDLQNARVKFDFDKGAMTASGIYKPDAASEGESDSDDANAEIAKIMKTGLGVGFELSECRSLEIDSSIFLSCKSVAHTFNSKAAQNAQPLKSEDPVLLSISTDVLSAKQEAKYAASAGKTIVRVKTYDMDSIQRLSEDTLSALKKEGLLTDALSAEFRISGSILF